MDNEVRNQRRKDGSLVFKDGHVLNMIATVQGLEQMVEREDHFLKDNIAVRPYSVWRGPGLKDYEQLNCVKIERFLMDCYEAVEKQGFLYVEADEVRLEGICCS